MATIFLEPGGDSTFDTTIWEGYPNGFCNGTIVSDFVHGNHLRSNKYISGQVAGARVLDAAGRRISVYYYIVTLPTSSKNIIKIQSSDSDNIFKVIVTPGGVLQLWDGFDVQMGSNGATLVAGRWYRISVTYNITDTTHNNFRLYVDGNLSISITNTTLPFFSNTSDLFFGMDSDATFDIRASDYYVDDSTSLSDTGNIWVTAKRPFSNGTINGFTTQIGSGGSGYGSGHSPQVNERALSTTNGWSMVGVGSAVTEEYNIENQATGDINITGASIIDFIGWVYASSLSSETAQIVVAGSNSNISLTSSNTMFTKVAGSTTYPAGTGTDIGIITATTITTVSLYECGVMVAYIPLIPPYNPFRYYKKQGFQ